MDTLRLLGGVLAQQGQIGRPGVAVVGHVMQGGNAPPGYPPSPQMPGNVPMNAVMYEALRRHQQAGGQIPPHYASYMNGPPMVQGAPVPQMPGPGFNQYQQDQFAQQSCNQQAQIFLEAMIIAAQADGQIDAGEQARILQKMQPLDPAELNWLRQEFATPHNLAEFASSVPQGLEQGVYQVTLLALRLVDHPAEVNYLRQLSQLLRLPPQLVNAWHQQFGVAPIF